MGDLVEGLGKVQVYDTDTVTVVQIFSNIVQELQKITEAWSTFPETMLRMIKQSITF